MRQIYKNIKTTNPRSRYTESEVIKKEENNITYLDYKNVEHRNGEYFIILQNGELEFYRSDSVKFATAQTIK